MFLGPR